MALTSRVEVAGFKNGQPATDWKSLGEIWNYDPYIVDQAAIKNKRDDRPRYLLNMLFSKANCDTILIRRKLINTSEKALWTVACPQSSLTSIKDNSFDPFARGNLKIIYFINCFVSPYWETIYRHHLNDLATSSLFKYPQSEIKIVANCEPSELSRLAFLAKQYFKLNPNIHNKWEAPRPCSYEILWNKEEYYEYPGIKLVHETAKLANKHDFIIYAHAKGVSHLESEESKCPADSTLASKMILRNAIINIDILNTIPSLNKIGPGLGGSGHMWFNFYLARASYIKKIPQPIRTESRHDYEGWLGSFPSDYRKFNDGLSLACLPYPTVSTSFDAREMINHINQNTGAIEKNLDESLSRLLE